MQIPTSSPSSQAEEPSNKSESATQSAKHLAPLVDYNPHLEKVPKSYHVIFFPGHTIEAHNTAIGIAIEPHIKFCLAFSGDKIMYIGKNISDDLLAKIRADPGVELVQLNYRPQPESDQ